jgi:hypothetical protein
MQACKEVALHWWFEHTKGFQLGCNICGRNAVEQRGLSGSHQRLSCSTKAARRGDTGSPCCNFHQETPQSQLLLPFSTHSCPGDAFKADFHTYLGAPQVLSNSSVQSGVGVYWGFYSGGDFQPIEVGEGAGVGPEQQLGHRHMSLLSNACCSLQGHTTKSVHYTSTALTRLRMLCYITAITSTCNGTRIGAPYHVH